MGLGSSAVARRRAGRDRRSVGGGHARPRVLVSWLLPSLGDAAAAVRVRAPGTTASFDTLLVGAARPSPPRRRCGCGWITTLVALDAARAHRAPPRGARRRCAGWSSPAAAWSSSPAWPPRRSAGDSPAAGAQRRGRRRAPAARADAVAPRTRRRDCAATGGRARGRRRGRGPATACGVAAADSPPATARPALDVRRVLAAGSMPLNRA